jgi:hypothetical protein
VQGCRASARKAAGQACTRLPGKAVCNNMLKAWWNWTIMQYSDQCVRNNKNNNNNNKNNKAKLRPALYVRTNAGKNRFTAAKKSKNYLKQILC